MPPEAPEVAEYLRQNPQFFEHHASLLADIHLPSPHGKGAISLAERQQVAQRDKIRALESRLSELVRFGEVNDALGNKVHHLALALLAAQTLEDLLRGATDSLHDDFQVPMVAIRLWGKPANAADATLPDFAPADTTVHEFARRLDHPHCGTCALPDLDHWFGTPVVPPRSCALIALGGAQPFGLLALGSEDVQRFYPGMGTLFLERIGQMLGTALHSHLA